MCLFVWFLDIRPFPHRVQWYRFLLNIPFTASPWVVPCYESPSTECIRIHIFSSITLYVGPGDGFCGTQKIVIGIFYSINLHVAVSVVCGWILFNPHMLCQPLFRTVCFLALITINLQILHSQSENWNFGNHDCILTASSEVSPIFTATLASAHLSLLLSLLAPASLLGP